MEPHKNKILTGMVVVGLILIGWGLLTTPEAIRAEQQKDVIYSWQDH